MEHGTAREPGLGCDLWRGRAGIAEFHEAADGGFDQARARLGALQCLLRRLECALRSGGFQRGASHDFSKAELVKKTSMIVFALTSQVGMPPYRSMF
ncbi:hypothetical protein [Sphingomonas daechungensis]|uniref:hypothetical protein n=1 Tax=Sphingomonas daechungensis TaxID=1176646 RepID=UPI001CB8AD43|nr:hypothetical protein [Sphingomonas daechungensis]